MKKQHIFFLLVGAVLLIAAAVPSPLYVGRFTGNGAGITNLTDVAVLSNSNNFAGRIHVTSPASFTPSFSSYNGGMWFTALRGSLGEQGQDHGLIWLNPLTLDYANPDAWFYSWHDHSVDGNELIIGSSYGIAIALGINGNVQMGTSDPTHDRWYLQYDFRPDVDNQNGYSKPLGFCASYWNGVGGYTVYPNIQAQTYGGTAADWALEVADGDNSGNPPKYVAGWQKGGTIAQLGNKRINFNKTLNFTGITSESTNNATVSLDFASHQVVDMLLVGTSVTLKTINLRPGTTNYSPRVFYLRSGSQTISLAYPTGTTGWNTNGASGGGLPASLTPFTVLELELRALGGVGETNVYVHSAQVLADNSYVLDPDVVTFIAGGYANVTSSSQKAALNTLVTSLKANTSTLDSKTFWVKLDGIYPFVGASGGTSYGKNLKQNNYHWTWDNTPTFDANGVVFNGSNQDGHNGFTPSTAGGEFQQNSATALIWITSHTMADNSIPMGCVGGGHYLRLHYLNSTTSNTRICDNSDHTFGTTFPSGRLWGKTRTSSTATATFLGSTYQSAGAISSTGLPTVEMYLGCENNGGLFNYSAIKIGFCCFGSGFSSTDYTALYSIISAYCTAVGR